MMRHEFLEVLVRIALIKYGERKASDSLVLLLDRMDELLPVEVSQDSDGFRKHYCYNALVDAELQAKSSSLAALFETYARGNQDIADRLQSQKMMSIGEWLLFLE